MLYPIRLYILLFIVISPRIAAQKPALDSLSHKTISAEPSFQKKSKFYQWLWGRNRRIEWARPINVPVLWLDTLYGGLKPYETGGGNETRSLHLRTVKEKEYSLRSIKKSRNDVIPRGFKKTFVEDIIKDGISSSHPYAALALAMMQEKAGIYHTLPTLGYLPRQDALDTFNKKYGNDLYLFEQRPNGNWSEANNLGNFKDFSNTDKVIKKLQEDNKYKADQYAFIKARLFDMFIGDWDRHENNWEWGIKGTESKPLYIPVPRDRDQAFYTHNGVLLDFVLPIAGYSYMQNFDFKAGNMATFNKEERDLDRFFANEQGLDDWVNAAKSLHQSLTDPVIEQSVQMLPPEIFAVCGKELIAKLKSRREQLVDFATTYYLFIAKEVEVTGSSQREYFEVNTTDSGEIVVAVSRIDSLGQREYEPYYKRTFKPSETREIRLFGINGEDVYNIDASSTDITIRVIGGPAKDSIIQSGNKIHIYDDRGNVFQTTSVKWHISSDSAVHEYDYKNYDYNSKGFGPVFFYDHQDRVYIGLSYRFKIHKWRRKPFATQHTMGINYSFSQHAVSASYEAIYPAVINHWDLSFNAKYDNVGWTNFSGLGNETLWDEQTNDYYQMRSREWFTAIGLHRALGKSAVNLSVFFQHQKIIHDNERYVAKVYQLLDPHVFDAANYTGLQLTYTYSMVNDSIVPTKGFTFLATGMVANDLTQKEFFQNYAVRLQAWVPLSNKFSFSVKAGGATAAGNSTVLHSARSYEHAIIGGPETFRGYRMDRFWGKTSFYNNNELRFITNLRTYLLNARAGIIAFFDDGRVWIPEENSNVLHTSYGGGILLAPFNQLCLTITYGISNETRLFQFRINTLF